MLEALGNRVIVLPDPVEEMSQGGIILNLDERQEMAACSTGTIIEFGPSAWLDPMYGGKPWVDVGDRVVFAKYSGKQVIDPDDNVEYFVVNDDAIQVRIK